MEVVMALALFSIAAGILSGSLYSGLQAYRAARNDTLVENRYRLVLRQVLAISDRDAFENSGRVELPEGVRAQWEASLEEAALVDLFNATVVIRLDRDTTPSLTAEEAATGRSFDLLLYRPSWSDITERARLLDERRTALQDRREGRR